MASSINLQVLQELANSFTVRHLASLRGAAASGSHVWSGTLFLIVDVLTMKTSLVCSPSALQI